MANRRPTLDSYIQSHSVPLSNAIRLLENCTFEFKPSLLQLFTLRLQFGGLPSENPLEHLAEFTSLCDGFKGKSPVEKAMLSLFPYILRNQAKRWLLQLLAGSISTWEELSRAFLSEYYSVVKILEFRRAISSFAQQEGEKVFEAWDRLKALVRSPPTLPLRASHDATILRG